MPPPSPIPTERRFRFPKSTHQPVTVVDPLTMRQVQGYPVPEAVVVQPERNRIISTVVSRALAVTHPHLARLYGLVYDEGRAWVVCELPKGSPLSEWARRDPKMLGDFTTLQTMIRQVGGALQDAHARSGLGHGRLTADHIFSPDGRRFEVTEFGFGALLDPSPDSTPAQPPEVSADARALLALVKSLATPPGRQGGGSLNDQRARADWPPLPASWIEKLEHHASSPDAALSLEKILQDLSPASLSTQGYGPPKLSRVLGELARPRRLETSSTESPFFSDRRRRIARPPEAKDKEESTIRESVWIERLKSVAQREDSLAQREQQLDKNFEDLALQRHVLQGQEESVKVREAAVLKREADVTAREAQTQDKEPRPEHSGDDLKEIQEQLDYARTELAGKDDRLKQQTDQIEQLQSQRNEIQSRLEQAATEFSTLRQKLEDSRTIETKLQSELTIKESELKRLQESLVQLESEKRYLENANSELKQHGQSLAGEKVALETKIGDTQRAHEVTCRKKDALAESLRQSIAQEKASSAALAAEVAALKRAAPESDAHVRNQLAEAQGEIRELRKRLEISGSHTPAAKFSMSWSISLAAAVLAFVGATWLALSYRSQLLNLPRLPTVGSVIVKPPAGTDKQYHSIIEGDEPRPLPAVYKDLTPGPRQAILRAPGLADQEITFEVLANDILIVSVPPSVP